MGIIFKTSKKVNVVPKDLNITKDTLWLVLNKVAGLLVVEIETNIILFANPNAHKILNTPKLKNSKFNYPIEIGSSHFTPIKVNEREYNLQTVIVSWENTTAYLIVISSNKFQD